MILYYKILLTLIINLQPLNIKKIHINLTTNINLFKKFIVILKLFLHSTSLYISWLKN